MHKNHSKFVSDDLTIITPQCHQCKHWTQNLRCTAFPDGIPLAILMNKHNHRQPFPGDHDIQFQEGGRDAAAKPS